MSALLWPSVVLFLFYAVIGGGLAWAVGLRGLWVVAAAPVFTTTIVGGTSVIAGWMGFGWSLLPCVVVAAVIALGILACRRLFASAQNDAVSRTGLGWRAAWTVAVLIVAAVIVGIQTLSVIGEPSAISQTFDNVFHMNAIRYILDTGAASPLLLGQMTSPNGGVPFYPSAWHATAAIVVQLTGVSIPVAINAQTVVIAALIWPAGAILLARTLVGSGPAVTATAGIVSTALPMFPLIPMDYGVLYPYQLALALVPVLLAATARLLGVSAVSDEPPAIGSVWWAVVVAGMVPGVALAHPGGFLTWLALSMPMVLAVAWRLWHRAANGRHRGAVAVGLLAYLLTGVVLLMVLRPPLATRQWPTVLAPSQAVIQALQVSMFYGVSTAGVALAAVLGIVWVFLGDHTRAGFVTSAMWAVGVVLFVVVISAPFGAVRDALTGGWYNNWPRLAAVFGIAVVPVASLGIARTAEAAGRLWDRALRGRRGTRVLAGFALAAVGFAVMPLVAMPHAIEQARTRFVMNNDSALISADEMALLARLADETPKDAVIAGNPYTGTALAYAISDRRVLMPHILVDVSKDAGLINDHLDDALEMPSVCEAAHALGVRYVLDFGDREVHGGSHPLKGLEHLATSGAVRLVDAEGDARLYEVTACRLG